MEDNTGKQAGFLPSARTVLRLPKPSGLEIIRTWIGLSGKDLDHSDVKNWRNKIMENSFNHECLGRSLVCDKIDKQYNPTGKKSCLECIFRENGMDTETARLISGELAKYPGAKFTEIFRCEFVSFFNKNPKPILSFPETIPDIKKRKQDVQGPPSSSERKVPFPTCAVITIEYELHFAKEDMKPENLGDISGLAANDEAQKRAEELGVKVSLMKKLSNKTLAELVSVFFPKKTTSLPAQESTSDKLPDSSAVFVSDSLPSSKEPVAISPLSVKETNPAMFSSVPALTEKQAKLAAQGVEFRHPDDIYLAMIPWGLIDPNPEQPRFDFEIKALQHMASTLGKDEKYAKNKQPIIVTERGGRFFLVDGERRWRAAQIANAELIFCLVFPEMTDIEVLIDSCLMNFCRENMNEYENALAFRHLMQKRGINQSELARQVGVHPVTISNALKFFKVHDDLLLTIKEKKMFPGIIKHFGSFPLDKQLELYKCCEEEIFSKGTKLNPGRFPRLLKKIAQRMKIKPIHAKDSRTRTYEEMVIGGLFLRIGGLKKELEEIRGISAEKLATSRNFNSEKVLSQLNELKEQITLEIERISSHHLN